MKIKILISLMAVMLSQSTPVHHKRGHQNTEPYPELRRVDCGRLYDAIIRQRQRILILLRAAKQDPGQRSAIAMLLPKEIETLKDEKFIYETVCREV